MHTPLGQERTLSRAEWWLKLRVIGVVPLVLAASLAGCSSTSTGSPQATHSILSAHDQLALPLPRLASDVSVTPHANGSATATFGLTYAVANTSSGPHVRADDATIVVRVARQLLPSGPSPAAPVFTKGFVDNHLDQATISHRYSVTIPAPAVSFLKSKGLAFVQSKTGGTTTTVPSRTPEATDALRLINIDVQQHRDFRHVDGSYDWTEGNFFTAASHPLQTATTHSGTLTVTNQTSQICTYANSGSVTNYGDPDTFKNCTSSNMATPVQLSGVATECFDQDTDSNPQGFAQENSAGVGAPEAPGVSITEPVVADDGAGLLSSDTESVNAGWAVSLAKAAVVTTANVLAGGPFGTIIEAGMDLAGYFSGTSCANDPNVMTLSATDTTGAGGASYGWAIDEEGMQNIYGTNFADGNGLLNNTVQLAYSSQVYNNNGSYQNPWLAEQVTENCGVGSGAGVGVGSCSGGGSNSEMNIQWTTNDPCTNGQNFTFNGIAQTGNPSRCAGSVPTTPAVSDCGTNNTTCPSQTSPQPALVPNVVGETYSQAASMLAKAGLGIYPTNLSPTAVITYQTPEESTNYVETPFVVLVSTSSSPPTTTPTTAPGPDVALPDIVGGSVNNAVATLGGVGIHHIVYSGANTNPPGSATVTSESPAPGEQVSTEATITLTTNAPAPATTTTTVPPPTTTTRLPSTVVVPNVVGMTYTAAAAACQAVGLMAFSSDGISGSTIVNSQSPAGGATLYLGQSVDLQNLPDG